MVKAVPLGEAPDVELARLRVELEIAETRRKLAEARQPWWRSGSVVSGLIAIVAATVPITTAIQGCAEKERGLAAAREVADQQARDRYLDSVLKEPRNAQVVLRFVESTTDDSKVRGWATDELERLGPQIDELDQLNDRRKLLYTQARRVTASLAEKDAPGEHSPELTQFWKLYTTDLLEVESTAVESIMVQLGDKLKACTAKQACERLELRQLAFQLSRQMQTEIEQAAPQPSAPR